MRRYKKLVILPYVKLISFFSYIVRGSVVFILRYTFKRLLLSLKILQKHWGPPE